MSKEPSPGPLSPTPTSHPLEDPLSLDISKANGTAEADRDDVPASFHSQGTIRGMATIRASKTSSSSQSRPGYFDLQRLAAQPDLSNNSTNKAMLNGEQNIQEGSYIRQSSKSRAASIYSTRSHSSKSRRHRKSTSSASSIDDGDGDSKSISDSDADQDEELPEWLNRVRRRSPAAITPQPRPMTQIVDFSTHMHSDTASTPSVKDESITDASPTTNKESDDSIEAQLNKAMQEIERWKKAYEDSISRHAREMSMAKRAQDAREAALLDILTSSGISKARAERALTYATAQSQVPVFRADERVVDNKGIVRSPTTRSTSSDERALPASLMEAMLDEVHSDLATPSISIKDSRSHSPSPSVRSSTSQAHTPLSAAPHPGNSSSGSSLNAFFTLNWRRKKPSADVNGSVKKGNEVKDVIDSRHGSPALAAPSSNAAATLNKALDKNRRRSKGREPNVTRLPSLFGQQEEILTEAKINGSVTQELEPMLAHDFRPPTLTMAARRKAGPKPQPFEKTKGQGNEENEDSSSSGDEFEVYGGKHLSPEELARRVASTIQRQREAGAEDEMLTDQYGFVYDATPADVRLLRRARKEESHAPACLTGIRVGVRARGGTESQSEDEKEEGDLIASDSEGEGSDTRDTTQTIPSKSVEAEMLSSLSTSVLPTPDHLKETMLSANSPGPTFLDVASCKPVVSASSLTAASQTSKNVGPTSPEEERIHFLGNDTVKASKGNQKKNASITVRRLLTQLQEMHTKQQDDQQAAWDTFLNKRKTLLKNSSMEKNANGTAVGAGNSMASKAVDVVRKGGDAFGFVAAANTTSSLHSNSVKPVTKGERVEEEWSLGGLIGLGQLGSNPKDQQEFQKLIQGGIPLVYRPKIWYECSGAIDRAEPGRYEELSNEHENEENACTKQIDLDVGRTMPTNIFFAGDGPGVSKLRRLLVAYSWYNPNCGYCQGMNNLAATLLLTHATEEEAFWVLASLIEDILPEDYFTSHLLTAQADQRVLMDFVRELIPKLADHIEDLGVDLPAVTFAWFLSLFTDCLPVETLFRVWDVLFVEGMAILFKIAITILVKNERELCLTNSASSFYSLMHSMTSHQFSADKLIAYACDQLKQVVTLPKIQERRIKHLQDLQVELGLDTLTINTNTTEDNLSGQRTPSTSSIKM